MKNYLITPINRKSFITETTFEKDGETTVTTELYRSGTAESFLSPEELMHIRNLKDGEEYTIKSAFIYDSYDICYSESDVDFFELQEDWEFDDQNITVIGPCEIVETTEE